MRRIYTSSCVSYDPETRYFFHPSIWAEQTPQKAYLHIYYIVWGLGEVPHVLVKCKLIYLRRVLLTCTEIAHSEL